MDVCDGSPAPATSIRSCCSDEGRPAVPVIAAPTIPNYPHLFQQAAFLNTVGVTALMGVSSSPSYNCNSNSSSIDTALQAFNEALGLMEQVSECPTLQKLCPIIPSTWNIIQTTHPLHDDRFFLCSQAFGPEYP